MRIAYVFTDLPDQEGIFSYAELEEMASRGLDLQIICLRSTLDAGEAARKLQARFPVHRAPYLSPGVAAAVVSLLLRRPARFAANLIRCVRETWTSPGILIKTLAILPKACLFAGIAERERVARLHAYWANLPGRAAWWISAFSGIPYGTWAHAGADIYNRKHQTKAALRTILGGADRVLTCNRTNLDHFREILEPQAMSRVLYHPHGVDVEFFSPSPDRDGACSEDGPLRLLSVGRLTESKGFHHAIRACGILVERGVSIRYRIVGDGVEEPRLRALVADLGLESNVEFPGPRDHAGVREEYRQAQVFLAPSIVGPHGSRNGLPNVLLEAMSSGLPAVASRTVAIPEAVEDGVTGLLAPPGDPRGIAAAVEKLAASPRDRTALGARARALVMERFSRPACMDRLLEILGSDRPGSPSQSGRGSVESPR